MSPCRRASSSLNAKVYELTELTTNLNNLHLLFQEGEELERLDIAKLSRVELNKLLVAKGIPTRAEGRKEEL